ncbi:testis-specific Y-encoded protein 1-like [Tamandua tetradactyla]|uniref:testis-specific Y-encoded protein 1-like n=1 Tax=Tamandua tetradactyla TaxID=48850 RepID=UPI004053E435
MYGEASQGVMALLRRDRAGSTAPLRALNTRVFPSTLLEAGSHPGAASPGAPLYEGSRVCTSSGLGVLRAAFPPKPAGWTAPTAAHAPQQLVCRRRQEAIRAARWRPERLLEFAGKRLCASLLCTRPGPMASEARPDEASAPPGCSGNLVGPAGGLLVGESVGPRGEQSPESSSAGAEAQAAAVREVTEGPSEETAILWVGMGLEIEKLEGRVEIEIRGETGLVNEDVMVLVEVVAWEPGVQELEVQEQEVQEQEEQEQEQESPQEREQAPPRPRTSTEALESLHLELSSLIARGSQVLCLDKRKLIHELQPYLDFRSSSIRCIAGFWLQTILNHPQLSTMITDQDRDLLSYMIDLEVEVCIPPKNCCTITFSFGRNPYFRNPVITKAYDITITGYLLSQTTPIQWFGDCECQAYRCSRQNTSMNFFNWISDHSPSGSSTIAEIICEDLWLNALQYYLRMGGPSRWYGEADREPSPLIWGR